MVINGVGVIYVSSAHATACGGFRFSMIAWYISGHGYGHAVRASAVINSLPENLPLIICSSIPEFFFHQELNGRPFQYRKVEFDCGALGPDSFRIDIDLSISRMEKLADQNGRLEKVETDWLKKKRVGLVVADIVPFALKSASRAGIRSVLIANFTWSGIYRHLSIQEEITDHLRLRIMAVVRNLEEDESRGDLLLAPSMDIPMKACQVRKNVPIIARKGTDRRRELAGVLKLDPGRPIYLLYLGTDGLKHVDWPALKELGDIQLVSYHPPPGTGKQVATLDSGQFDHADMTASVDAVIAKPGYNTCGECIAANTPLLYHPRPQFAETAAIEKTLEEWGGAVRIRQDDFNRVDWMPYLEQLNQLNPDPDKISCDGAACCADAIMHHYPGGDG
jgi:hypothetical protein